MIHPSTSKFREAFIETLSLDSKPKGLMRMAIKNQDMIAWHIPKDKIAGLSNLAVETNRPGIYFLVSDSRIHPNGQPIYVGKATNELLIMDNGHVIDASELSSQPVVGDVLSYIKTFGYEISKWDSTPKETSETAYVNIKIMN